MSTKILVTGGAGFIGQNLCKKLLEDPTCEVVVLDDFSTGKKSAVPKGVEIIEQDVRDSFETFECDQIYHLACPASPLAYQKRPIKTVETAFVGTKRALECAEANNATLLIASTSEVYGEPIAHPQSEQDYAHFNPVGPRSCYDAGKAAAESLAVSFANVLNIDVRIARIFNTYGPGMDLFDGRVVSNFIRQALNNEPLTIYGDGYQTRSFCYVDDLVQGLYAFMNRTERGTPHTPINLGNPDEISVLDVATLVLGLIPTSTSKIQMIDLPVDDPSRRCPNITLAKQLIAWNPRTNLRSGLEKTIRYWRNQP